MFSIGGIIRRVLPRTLLGRSLLIIVSPLILLQIFSAWVFFERHWDTVATRLARGLAGDIAATMVLLRENPGPKGRKAAFTFAHTHFQVRGSFREKAILKNATPRANPGRLERVLRKALSDRTKLPLAIDAESFDRDVIIDIQLPDGVLHLIAPRKRLFTSTTYLFIGLMAGSSMILFAVAMIFMRNQIRPIRRLAMAADALGKGHDVEVFRIQGATEVRQAATAFNRMRDRLQRQVSQRTEMLAGVSHDLRTPLTRMKLQLAMLGGTPSAQELKADVAEMERMVEGYLAFARGEGTEPVAQTNLRDLVEDVVAAARRAGNMVDFTAEGVLTLSVRKEGLRRCIANLVSNATQYGTRAVVSAIRKPDFIELTVDDDGPGIPEKMHETVFRPFSRLDQSRNVETGGVGLGLTIARDMVHAHGGEIALGDSPLGGLRARIRLPV
ncbi:MAG: ATP-binding protein [Alphaproteobacteria bacterium]|nr:ATP-binding protein [Alphaproteobacteria bacterium]MCZ6609331.1 ATP-binding protein [Alphaproteobacteria bacterium]MCZ6813006.1 ATP-binding protein [Alphaproteobacteria bacterium]